MSKIKLIAVGIIAFLLLVIIGLLWNIGRNQKPNQQIVDKLTSTFANSQGNLTSSTPDFGEAKIPNFSNNSQNISQSNFSIFTNFSTNSSSFSGSNSNSQFSQFNSTNNIDNIGEIYSNSFSNTSIPAFSQSELVKKMAVRDGEIVNFGQFTVAEIIYQANLEVAQDGSTKIKISIPENRPITVNSPRLTDIFIENIESTNENGVFLLTQRIGNGIRVQTKNYRIDLKKAVENPNAEVILEEIN